MSIINKFFLENFYQLGKDFVRYYPKRSNPCEQLHTFAVLESFADLNTPNLAKTVLDRGKPFFWSRKWAATQYNPSKLSAEGPVMVVFDEAGVIDSPFNVTKATNTRYNLQLTFLQKYEPSNKIVKDSCKSMTRNEIYLATETFAKNFFAFLLGVKYYPTKGFQQADIAETEYPDIDPDPVITRQFQNMLRSENQQISFNRWEGGVNNYYGTYLSLSVVSETCEDFYYDNNTHTFKLGYDRGCC